MLSYKFIYDPATAIPRIITLGAALLIGQFILRPILSQTLNSSGPQSRTTFTAVNIVNIQHNLNSDVLIQCFDNNGFMIQPSSVRIVNQSQVVVQFNNLQSGRCIVK